jgi:hypothetical protein
MLERSRLRLHGGVDFGTQLVNLCLAVGERLELGESGQSLFRHHNGRKKG